MTTTVSLFDYDLADRGVTAGTAGSAVDPDTARKRLEDARHRLLVAESAHRSAIVRAEAAWLRALPPTIGRHGAARIEAVHSDLEEARRQARRPWAAAARRQARLLQIEEQVTLEHYGFADYGQFASRDEVPGKPELSEPAEVRRARKAVARAEGELEASGLSVSA